MSSLQCIEPKPSQRSKQMGVHYCAHIFVPLPALGSLCVSLTSEVLIFGLLPLTLLTRSHCCLIRSVVCRTRGGYIQSIALIIPGATIEFSA